MFTPHNPPRPHNRGSRGFHQKISNDATDTQIAVFPIALKMKGETLDEIAGLAKGMKKSANLMSTQVKGTLVDDRHISAWIVLEQERAAHAGVISA